jgi:hypothetical protein
MARDEARDGRVVDLSGDPVDRRADEELRRLGEAGKVK